MSDLMPSYEDDLPAAAGHNSDAYAYDADLTLLDEVPTDASLARARDLAKLQVEREREVDRLTEELRAAKLALAQVSEHELPDHLTDLCVRKLPLANGATITVKTKVVANVIVADRPVFFNWLHKVGDGAIVKRAITVEGGRGDAKKLGKLLAIIRRHYKDFRCVDQESVHAGTLNAWAREFQEKNLAALASGGKMVEPPEVLKLTELRESVIVVPKGKSVSWE